MFGSKLGSKLGNKKDGRAVAIIPARLGSTRFPRKALADDTGKPMVVHVCEQAAKAESVSRVVVATDAEEIKSAVEAHGFEAVMTSEDHPNGSSRLAQATKILKLKREDLIVNIQGDEPEIEPRVIDAAICAPSLVNDPPQSRFVPCGISVGTVASPIRSDDELKNPNIVKVVTGIIQADAGVANALYFSRSAIPFNRQSSDQPSDQSEVGMRPLRHVGIYAYTCDSLRRYTSWHPTPLEQIESLEQLRWLEHGFAIAVAICQSSTTGIDTPEQYQAFVDRYRTKKT